MTYFKKKSINLRAAIFFYDCLARNRTNRRVLGSHVLLCLCFPCLSGRPRGPLRWLDPGAFGTLGVGAGFALGVKLCNPSSDVWVIFGDGALGYSMVEFDTFVRHNVSWISAIELIMMAL